MNLVDNKEYIIDTYFDYLNDKYDLNFKLQHLDSEYIIYSNCNQLIYQQYTNLKLLALNLKSTFKNEYLKQRGDV